MKHSRRIVAALTVLSLSLVVVRPAFAHGFGQRYDLPVPLWLYLFGAAAAVLLSFVLVVLFAGREAAPLRYPRLDLLRVGAFRVTLASRPFLIGLRLVSIALFALVILSGLFGNQSPEQNFAPTFVWIIWWVGMSMLVAFVGNVWEMVNPWKILFDHADALARRLGMEGGLELGVPYPAAWGVWPALAFFFIFAWIELVFWGSAIPFNIAGFAFLYSGITWAGMVVFGRDIWLRNGEVFTVFFGTLARFAPTEIRTTEPGLCEDCAYCATGGGCVNCQECFALAAPEERELNLRPPGVGLLVPQRMIAGQLAFVLFMLASVSYDGLLATPHWAALIYYLASATGSSGSWPHLLFGTLGLAAIPLVFLVLYTSFVKLCQVLGGASFGRLANQFAYSLVPIALAYQIAHYYTLILTDGQMIIAHISEPFGWGWDLFGTADYQQKLGVVGAASVWYSQVGLIVSGHVIAVYLAHAISLRSAPNSKYALRSQYPMMLLMVLYTILSLWILSQPIVE